MHGAEATQRGTTSVRRASSAAATRLFGHVTCVSLVVEALLACRCYEASKKAVFLAILHKQRTTTAFFPKKAKEKKNILAA